jgi:hypothetical protein
VTPNFVGSRKKNITAQFFSAIVLRENLAEAMTHFKAVETKNSACFAALAPSCSVSGFSLSHQ